ncbi:MAG TPA: SUMF1/EgtB/PvdO family nonheme iron enzyme [Abditibacterium sp.]|jgi:formylglycine-generating enzyme required for sulfatase activity
MRVLFSFAVFVTLCVAANAQTAPEVPAPEGMVLVEAGEFWMGTNDADRSNNNQRDNVPLTANDARPRHRAQTGAFWIDKTEVTCAQYQKFCEATGFPTPPDWVNGTFAAGKADFPVTRVNWYEATAYARWSGKRLPTEAEWEKAARGAEGRLYPWGNDWDPSRSVSSGDGPLAVGSRPTGASPYGALDMTGNVMEWTSSWFDGYPNSPTSQPDFGTKFKVARGGAWMGNPTGSMAWYRSVNQPRSRIEWIGFRCVKDNK